ncbi:hypothetical protein DT075_38665 [Bacillus licheniformis]|nr:hypothetical protein DT075_38665 [Bacillus licheniformis]
MRHRTAERVAKQTGCLIIAISERRNVVDKDKKGAKQDLSEILQFVAPGTPLREGIENVLRAKTGGLIVVGFNDKVKEVVDGGFHINSSFSPA